MNINKQILVTFAILIVQITCNLISDDDEVTVETIDENFELHTDSAYRESIVDKYQTQYKRSLEAKRSFQKDTKNSKETSEPEYSYSYFAQRLNPNFSKWDLSEDESKPNYREKYESLTTEEIWTNNRNVPVPAIPMGEDGFRVLIELGINPFHLDKPVNLQIVESIQNIYNELITLIGVDIQSNIFPLVFYQTLSPIIKEKLLPLLEVQSLKQEVAIVDKDYKVPVLFIILRDLIEISKDFGKDYTISNFFRIIDKDFNERIINDNEGNKILVKLYKNNVERIQELLDEDWKENEAPVNFIKYISDYFRREKFLVIGKIFNQMLTQKLERNVRLKVKDIERLLKSLELSEKDEL